MPDLKPQHPVRPSALARQGAGPGQTRTLQTANKEALHHLGLPSDTPGDPKGRVLRHLRLQMGIDPSVLATQACMSLSQLYELEDGGNSRFYSDSLRRQAGRRVAKLLGADWDHMELEVLNFSHTSSNVVPLQRPGSAPISSPVVERAPTPDLEVGQSITMLTDAVPAATAPNETQALFMGLSSPAVETVYVEPSNAPYGFTPHSGKKSFSGWRFLFILLLVIAAGISGAYVFVEYSPYRLYWPW